MNVEQKLNGDFYTKKIQKSHAIVEFNIDDEIGACKKFDTRSVGTLQVSTSAGSAAPIVLSFRRSLRPAIADGFLQPT